jgi:antirestriction protein ArdC
VLLWKPSLPQEEARADWEPGARSRFIARAFTVFNVDQVDGLARPELDAPAAGLRQENAETFFSRFADSIWFGSKQAFYDRASDTVSLPDFNRFVSGEAYYTVLAHELTHWTGAEHRLNRDLTGRFGDEAYAMEELVAELGAAFTVGHLGQNSSPRHDHAPYIANWLKVLNGDPRAIMTAASKAQSAADYLIGFESAATIAPKFGGVA